MSSELRFGEAEERQSIKDSAADGVAPTDADMAAAKVAAAWLEEGTPEFTEESYDNASAAIRAGDGGAELVATYRGQEEFRMPIDEFSAMVARAGMFCDRAGGDVSELMANE